MSKNTIAKYKMEPLEVAVTNSGEIEIIQDYSPHEESPLIRVMPDQVDILIEWLKKAKEEALKVQKSK